VQIAGFIWFLIAPKYYPAAFFRDDEEENTPVTT
jgi:hypothetical protein